MEKIGQANEGGDQSNWSYCDVSATESGQIPRPELSDGERFDDWLTKQVDSPIDHNIDRLIDLYGDAYGGQIGEPGDSGERLYQCAVENEAIDDEPINQLSKQAFESRMDNRWARQKTWLIKSSGDDRIISKLSDSDDRISEDGWHRTSGEWEVVDSYCIKQTEQGGKVVMPSSDRLPIEHCFYLNPTSLDLYKVLKVLVEQYDQRQMPFSLKYTEQDRADRIVIYSTTRRLKDNYEAIRRVSQQYPALAQHLRPVLPTVGTIGGKIGYSQGVSRIKGMSPDVSYNSLRTGLLARSLDYTMAGWLVEHRNDRLGYNGKKLTVTKFMAKRLVDNAADQVRRGDARDYLSPALIERRIAGKFNDLVKMVDANNYSPAGVAQSVEICRAGDELLRLSWGDIRGFMASIAPWVNTNNRFFAQQVKDNIRELSPQYNVNAINFILDDNDAYL